MKYKKSDLLIGFIGQGFVGKNYADDFERRGYKIVRYSQEKEYVGNKDLIKKCDIVLIAVPTPTTKKGFDSSILESTLKLIGKGKIAVIKSTVVPGTTKKLQKKFPSIIVMHSPEFLREIAAREDAENPARNIIGIVKKDKKNEEAGKFLLSILPKAPYSIICGSEEAEIIKYGHNSLGFIKILFTNIIYDLSRSFDADWESIKQAMTSYPENTPTYMNPVHKTGRGAGGRCFIKDFAAFRESYEKNMPKDKEGISALRALEQKNISLLRSSNKSLDILSEIYG